VTFLLFNTFFAPFESTDALRGICQIFFRFIIRSHQFHPLTHITASR
jgi:hypothetical protein